MIRVPRLTLACALSALVVLLLVCPSLAQESDYEATSQLPDPETTGTSWTDSECAPVASKTVPSTITGYYSSYLTGLHVQYNTSNNLNTCNFHGGLVKGEVPMVCDTPVGQNITTVTVHYDSNYVYQLDFTYTSGPECFVGDLGASTNSATLQLANAYLGYFAGYSTSTAITAIQFYFFTVPKAEGGK